MAVQERKREHIDPKTVVVQTTGSVATSKSSGRRYIGEILVASGLIDQETLDKALEIHKAQGKRVGRVLIDMGVVDDTQIAQAIADQLAIPFVKLSGLEIPREVIALVPRELAKHHIVIPLARQQKKLTLMMANPLDIYAVNDVRFATLMSVEPVIAPELELITAIDKYYSTVDILRPTVFTEPQGKEQLVIYSDDTKPREEDKDLDDLLNLSDRPPVVRFTNAVISDAIKLNASDIHIEPQRNSVIIRYRIDGVMREVMKTERHVHTGVATRIKAISKMDIANRRSPQDGKLQVTYNNNQYDLRISTLPTAYGEKVTIRLLSPVAAPASIDDLDFTGQQLIGLRNAINQPQGMVLATGPTGSGKTTTLYACLKTLLSPEVNIVTLENPIEYEIEGINQVEINPKAGLSFKEGLRSVLRQDPDIILLGEIRDAETAAIAFHAAQTGHLVLSTLHTNNAPAAIARLIDLGVESFNISTALNAVLAQRLVRRLCKKCKIVDHVGNEVLLGLPAAIKELDTVEFWQAQGCDSCSYTGYSGRVGIHEILQVTPKMQKLIAHKAMAYELEEQALSEGFRTMSVDGVTKASQGLTTLSEVYRVAPPVAKELIEVTQDFPQADDGSEIESLSVDDSPVSVGSVAPRRILIAEDNEILLRLIQGIVEGEGYVAYTAENGAEALKIALKEVPDLIIADYLMPEIDGITLIRKLRATLATSYIPMIILTAVEENDVEVEGINAGADDFLIKPINPKTFIARINRLLKKQFN